MNNRSAPSAWHADDQALRDYAAGRTDSTFAASVEAHLLGCPGCRAALGRLVEPAPLAAVWERVAVAVQEPRPSLTERFARRLGLAESDALLLAAAPALRSGWVLGVLVCALFALTAAPQDGALLPFLVVAPLLPVAAVAFAYGSETDPLWETTLATPYSPLRLILLRVLAVLGGAVPLVLLATPVLPGPWWLGAGWLLPGACCAAVSLALATWLRMNTAAGTVAVTWTLTTLTVDRVGVEGLAVLLLTGPAVPAYAALTVAAAAVFWLRHDHVVLPGRIR